FRFGIGIKPIISSIPESNPDLGYESFYAISPSITVDYKFTNNILLSSGLEYEKKGGKGELFVLDKKGAIIGESEFTLNLNFLQLPLIATYRSSGKIKFYANVGLTFGYLFDQRITHEDNSGLGGETNFDELELSLLLGAGIEIKCNDHFDLGIGLRDNDGFTTLKSENEALELKTNTLGIMVNLSYNL
ncbi:MAG: outer membrane beta-barrel protein, partial [Vicingaceae bacterium]